uniref:RNA dependent RNA polymerase n=1 Tax=Beijing sediment mito-like virus 5 TaxID=2937046 RepID=A0A9Y1G5A0_9VIRU|nr:MAG: putative RNA dependent RNA polymerase [Beijing sediment mito-like virus 5]
MVNIVRLIADHLNPELIKAVLVFMSRLSVLQKKGGLTFVALTLKACHIYVMQFIASSKRQSFINSCSYGVHVSLTSSGLPRLLPLYFRNKIRDGDKDHIKIVLTLCNLYRVLPFPGKVKLATITDEWKGSYPCGMISFIPKFWSLLNPKPFTFIWNPFAIMASGSIVNGKRGNSMSGFFKALLLLYKDKSLWESITWFFNDLPARRGWKARTQSAFKGLAELAVLLNAAYPNFPFLPLGRLAFKEEPGKVRVFAMSDCVTQWVLHPLHQWLFTILRSISSVDATFDQQAGVDLLQSKIVAGKRVVFSLDLSAATDRLPLLLQQALLNCVYPKLGDHWANLLVNRDYSVPPHSTLPVNPGSVRYGAGQPMGAYSSWAMLAITHHFIVQYCAFRVYNKVSFFQDYLVLGDDLLLLDPKVAKMYLSVMKQLDVGVNLSKSLVSDKGIGEFAKQLISPSGLLQGLSLKEFSSLGNQLSNVLALSKKLKAKRSNILRLFGFGSLSCGHSVPSFFKRSMRSMLDHLLVSPLCSDKYDWFTWFSLISHACFLDISKVIGYIYYFLWSFEYQKYKFVGKLGLEVDAILRDQNKDVAAALLSYWAPRASKDVSLKGTSYKSLAVIPEEEKLVLEWLKNHLNSVFSSGSLFSTILYGASPDLVPRCISWELSFESENSYHLFSQITTDFLWSVVSRDPKAWIVNNYLGQDYFDINDFMSQQESSFSYRPDSLKDMSLALQLKADFFKEFVINKKTTILDIIKR